jgi:hypothetical protein
MKSPFSSIIKYPAQVDTFENMYDSGANSSAHTANTKLWAEHYNKLGNFIGKIEPLIVTNTASGDGSFKVLSYAYTLTPVPLFNIFQSYAYAAARSGNAPPTNILPFEFVITSSSDDYTNWPFPGALLFQSDQATINNLIGGIAFNGGSLLASINLSDSRDLLPRDYTYNLGLVIGEISTKNWITNHYISYSSDTLLIRGAIINTLVVPISGDNLYPIATYFPSYENLVLKATIIGVN